MRSCRVLTAVHVFDLLGIVRLELLLVHGGMRVIVVIMSANRVGSRYVGGPILEEILLLDVVLLRPLGNVYFSVLDGNTLHRDVVHCYFHFLPTLVQDDLIDPPAHFAPLERVLLQVLSH